MDHDEHERRLGESLDAVDRALCEGDLDAARRALAACVELTGADDPDVLYAGACIAWQDSGPEAAGPVLERVVELEPNHADAHYGLGQLAEDRGERSAMIAHLLKVQSLDARADRAARIGTATQLDHVEAVARKLLETVPSPFAERLEHVPVVLERRPSRDLVKAGFDPRALGLFEGPTDGDRETMAPTRIVLYVNNLLADYPEDPMLSEQIQVTLLHEIGHYFNLDEDDMVRLGLD
ncbi:MAG: metallopeptidase family protein [Myxococcales bacterium]|nr:metallopeptidase family protein [Myxococcales bacterium]